MCVCVCVCVGGGGGVCVSDVKAGADSHRVRWGFTLSKVGVHIRHIITKGGQGACPPGKKLIFGKNRVHFL